METPTKFAIQFKDEEVILDLVEELNGICKYKTERHSYDLELDERSSITFLLEVAPITIKEKRSALFFNLFSGKTIKPTNPS